MERRWATIHWHQTASWSLWWTETGRVVSSGALGWRSNDWWRDPVRSLHWAREAREFGDEEERRYYRTPRMVSRSCVLCVCVCVCVFKPPCLYSPLCHVRAGTCCTDEMGTEVGELQGWSGPGIHATPLFSRCGQRYFFKKSLKKCWVWLVCESSLWALKCLRASRSICSLKCLREFNQICKWCSCFGEFSLPDTWENRALIEEQVKGSVLHFNWNLTKIFINWASRFKENLFLNV